MTKRILCVVMLAAFACGFEASPSGAGLPFPGFTTCRVQVTQNPCRPACINNFSPDVVRLCPSSAAPVFDRVLFNLVLRDALNLPISGAVLSLFELSGTVNIATGGSTTAVTDSSGRGSVVLERGSGCGRVGVCADGVLICEVSVRSPDIARTALGTACALPTTGTSFVNSNDKNNVSCGFIVNFGPVTAGVNDCWDLNCDNLVNSSDTNGSIAPPCPFGSGWLQHFGHGDALGVNSTCP